MSQATDEDYLAILTGCIQVYAAYKPKLGRGAKVGYDLASFFQRNSPALRKEVEAVLRTLLTPS